MKAFPLVPSLHCHQAPLLSKKPQKRGSEKQFCLVGVPQGLVLGPSQISYSPGAMFFPQGVAPQTDSQTAHPLLYGPGAASQPAHNSPEILLSGKRAQWSLCWGALLESGCLSVFLSDTLSCHLILSHFPLISQSEARRECIFKAPTSSVPFCCIMEEKRAF